MIKKEINKMFTFYNTTTEYYKLDEDELENLYNDYKEYCNENEFRI